MNIEALKKLLEEATPGPWKDDGIAYIFGTCPKVGDAMVCEPRGPESAQNAQLIVALRNIAPELIRVVEEAYANEMSSPGLDNALDALDRKFNESK